MSRRTTFVVVLLVSLVVAGVLSRFASESPDGLEAVAESTGLADQERESATADGPLADYSADGVAHEGLAGGVAGVAGVGVVLLLTSGLVLLVRRRDGGRGPADPADAEGAEAGRG